MRLLTAILSLTLAAPAFAGTATQARNLTRSYDQEFQAWIVKVQAARGKDAQADAWAARPNVDDVGKNLWVEIRNNLNESWTLDYAAWLYENAPAVLKSSRPGVTPPTKRIHDAVARFHVRSPRVGYYCVAVPRIPNPGSLSLLEKVEKENPDPRVQGAAALGQAMLLRGMGDNWKLVGKRQEKLRQAIIKGNDLPVGKTTLLRLADDEIFIMNNLSVGAEAPDIKGVDIGLKPFSLADHRGKVVVLAFWHTWMPEAERSIDLLRALHTDLQGKNAVVLGVNQDHALTLRKMTADGTAPWRNFSDSTRSIAKNYRIHEWPKVFVIDVDGKIVHIDAPGAFVNIAVDSLLKK